MDVASRFMSAKHHGGKARRQGKRDSQGVPSGEPERSGARTALTPGDSVPHDGGNRDLGNPEFGDHMTCISPCREVHVVRQPDVYWSRIARKGLNQLRHQS
jgi:hypothetical protein